MPWSAARFRSKHNKGLSKGQASKASSIANAILREGGSEGKAIRIANASVKRMKKGK
jgi:uncharacterized protein YdaT